MNRHILDYFFNLNVTHLLIIDMLTSHISPECALNPNAPTFVGQSANNYILHSSPGLQTSMDMMIINTVRAFPVKIISDGWA